MRLLGKEERLSAILSGGSTLRSIKIMQRSHKPQKLEYYQPERPIYGLQAFKVKRRSLKPENSERYRGGPPFWKTNGTSAPGLSRKQNVPLEGKWCKSTVFLHSGVAETAKRLTCNEEYVGANPSAGSNLKCPVVQLAARLTLNQEVLGANPSGAANSPP